MARKSTKKEPDLVDQLRAELNKCKGDWARLARLTKGSEVEFNRRWLFGFASGEIVDPSARRVIELGKYLGMKVVSVPGPHFMKFTPTP